MNLGHYLLFAVVYLIFGLILLVGLALVVNFSINIGAILGIGKSKPGLKINRKSVRNKLSKRRKEDR